VTVVGVFEYPTFATSLYLELFYAYSIAHYGADRVLTASRPSRQKAGGIIVEDSGVFHFSGALDAVRAIQASRTTVRAVFLCLKGPFFSFSWPCS